MARNHPPDCIKKSMFFQTHTEPEEDSKDSHSKCNKREVVLLSKVATHLCDNRFRKDKITVLCSYRGQVKTSFFNMIGSVLYMQGIPLF